LSDPLIDNEVIETKPFTEAIVNEYLQSSNTFEKHPLWHYQQPETIFDNKQIIACLRKLEIPTIDNRATVIGGFTGQFSSCLRDIGMKVTFTDPMDEWVSNASNIGFESFRYSAASLPRTILERTDICASFECYYFLPSSREGITCLRLLTTKQGLLFVESKLTHNAMRKKCGSGVKHSFRRYHKKTTEKQLILPKQNRGLSF
jgi:hypothetical protein